MSRSNPSHPRIRRTVASILAALMLLSVAAAPVYADPGTEDSDVPATETVALPVWNGGSAEAYSGGNGTQGDPYRISSGEELSLLAQEVRAGKDFAGVYFTLTGDLQLNDVSNFAGWGDSAPARRWIPIGGYATVHIGSADEFQEIGEASGGLLLRTEEGYVTADKYQSGVIYYRLTAFNGIFDGGGHTISGLYTAEGGDYTGLFGLCRNATLTNIHLESLYIKGGDTVGGLAGALWASDDLTVSNCSIDGTVIGNDTVGGLFGFAEAEPDATLTISASRFDGRLSGHTAVGGILGETGTKDGTLQLLSCQNDGRIEAATALGGIVGKLAGNNDQISECKNNGPLRGESAVGGIVGLVAPHSGIVTVSDVLNGGTALSDGTLGGVVGEIRLDGQTATLELLSCRNVGDLFGNEGVGGIVGMCTVSGTGNAVNLAENKNSALIRGKSRIGGIIGNASADTGTISVGTSENYGGITAAEHYAGGIIGAATSSATLHLYECSARATVTVGKSYAGGIGGLLTAADGSVLIERCSAGGTIKADLSTEGVAGSVLGKLESASAGSSAELRNCLGAAVISAKGAAGGLVGHLTAVEGTCRIRTSLFCGGIVIGCKVTGEIAATALAENEGAVAQIADCYYAQGSSTRAMLPGKGQGTESCVTTEALPDGDLRNPEKLSGLDFTVWTASEANEHYPTPGSIPFVWEEYQYTVTRDGVLLDAYLGRSDVVVIPEKLGGVAVTTISDQAFWQSEIIRITLPDSVSAIGEAAFAGCANLERVTLSAGLVSIGARAFQGCTSLSQLRCTETLSTLVVGGENEPYKALSLTHPVALQVVHSYEDGGSAGKSTSLLCYVGDYYRITPLTITGYEADSSMLSGICHESDRVSVIYHIGTYRLTVRYLYPDGSEAFPTYESTFRFGESYSIATPQLDGYSADRMLVDGTMPGEDTQITVYFSQVFVNEKQTNISTLEVALLILSGLTTVCCLVYFIYRYRSSAEAQREANKESLWKERRF